MSRKRALKEVIPDVIEAADEEEIDEEAAVHLSAVMAARGEEEDEDDESDADAGDEDSTGGAQPGLSSKTSAGSYRATYKNKQRVLIIASRGITARYRHLLEDFKHLIPHHKKDNKLDSKGDINAVNEIADMKSCNQVLYLETRKHQDLYLYLGRTPSGPSVKFHVVNIHTMDELKLTGNCMLGSRPLLNFDAGFDKTPHMQLIKTLLADAFGTPLGHPKCKPFLDRVMSFFVIKNCVWVRNYQIVDKSEKGSKKNDSQLVEIGPRFVLIPIRIFSGSLGGPTLYQNPAFVSPNDERAAYKKRKGDRYVQRTVHSSQRREFLAENTLPADELSSKNVFK